ncbi:MAG: nucleotidyltransferase family protein [Clostridiales bacterium]|nr:nucleotidyltransferase family protein [Candidatus Blautia equi]
MEQIFSDIGCVIMASGMGKRFGSNKLLADFAGKPMIQYILDTTKAVFANRVVVTRHKEVEEMCLAQQIPVVLHDFPGRNDTVRLGLEALGLTGNAENKMLLEHCIFCPSDQPLLTEKTLRALAESAAGTPEKIWRLSSQGLVGAPVIFPSWTYPELTKLPEGKGGGVVIRKYPEQVQLLQIENALELKDADTRETLQELVLAYRTIFEKNTEI